MFFTVHNIMLQEIKGIRDSRAIAAAACSGIWGFLKNIMVLFCFGDWLGCGVNQFEFGDVCISRNRSHFI